MEYQLIVSRKLFRVNFKRTALGRNLSFGGVFSYQSGCSCGSSSLLWP